MSRQALHRRLGHLRDRRAPHGAHPLRHGHALDRLLADGQPPRRIRAVTAHDVVLLISKGGASDEVILSAQIARRRGAKTIALTASHESPLAQACDLSARVAVAPGRRSAGSWPPGSPSPRPPGATPWPRCSCADADTPGRSS
ncbi:SIS domain-containing protein [Microbacterium sp. NIBRBAC000506063]|nr:SIS domain-containing protein [Microbacterium sp. NIBRBAC000506063]